MEILAKLNFPHFDFRIENRADGDYIWCDTRCTWLRLTPEEWVRRNTVAYLIESGLTKREWLREEFPVQLHRGESQRADIVCFSANFEPQLLVECKAPEVTINQSVLAQAVRYNSKVGARYIMLTNGLTHFFYSHFEGNYIPLKNIPIF